MLLTHIAVEIVTNWLSDAIKLNFLWRKREQRTHVMYHDTRSYEFIDDAM
jgi:hypothetical protein